MSLLPPLPDEIDIHPGPALLDGLERGPGLAAHRQQYDEPRASSLAELQALVEAVGLRGRGGAAFPFATKLAAAGRGRRALVVVNLAEGETASSKDTALALRRPHLVLDGAITTARALKAREVHVVLPGERPLAAERMRAAMAERTDGVRLVEHVTEGRFVSGQARAVVELIERRPNLPVTAWDPEAVSGVKRRPTLLSNAETWAHVGLLVLRGAAGYRLRGTTSEPGTTLLTVTSRGARPAVHEVAYGSRLRDVLPVSAAGSPGIVGGFHGSWATWPTLANALVSVPGMTSLGAPLGAGVVLLPGPSACCLQVTTDIVEHLAGQSTRRCGPCFNGLPALAEAVRGLLEGTGSRQRVEELCGLVARRGACAHPDGTVRLVRSLLLTLPDEVAAHQHGSCTVSSAQLAGAAR